MTPEQTELIRRSFDAIWPVRRKLADQFYRRFFELAPDAQGLFRGDMERQYLKLMDMIAAIVGTLDKREMFQSIISHSGRQHAQFGAKPSHFAALGDALIWGSNWSPLIEGKVRRPSVNWLTFGRSALGVSVLARLPRVGRLRVCEVPL